MAAIYFAGGDTGKHTAAHRAPTQRDLVAISTPCQAAGTPTIDGGAATVM
ncbi:MAG TPA: hypothetical protein VF516_41560 [Kofleriaceae bacterium]